MLQSNILYEHKFEFLSTCPIVYIFIHQVCLCSVDLMFFSLVFSSTVFIFCFFNIFLCSVSIRPQPGTLINGATAVLIFQDISLWQVCNCYIKVAKARFKEQGSPKNYKDFSFLKRTNFHVLPYFSPLLPSEYSLFWINRAHNILFFSII